MRLGIMQPYFFPYLGYFALIRRCDRWVAFDVVKYNRRSWMNRNRILHPGQGWQYVSVPVRQAPLGTPLRDVYVPDPALARDRLLGQLAHYRRHAPYWSEVVSVVKETFERAEDDRLLSINQASLASVCAYLGMPWQAELCSGFVDAIGEVAHPGQWALRIAEHLGAAEYLNPPGGRLLFQPDEWSKAGIRLRFTNMPDFTYDCGPYTFVEHLSILDVLMWNQPARVLEAMDAIPIES